MARPREADRIDIPARAIHVAIELFETRGIDRVTLQDIAAEVGCRAPALYRYFPNKEALLLAVHNEGFRRLYATKLDVGEATRPNAFERLRQGGLAYVRFAHDNPRLYELMFNDRAPFRQLIALQVNGDAGSEDFARHTLTFLRESILACQAEGYLLGLDPDITAFTFWSSVHGAISLSLRQRAPDDGNDSGAIAARAVDTMMHFVAISKRGGRDDGSPSGNGSSVPPA